MDVNRSALGKRLNRAELVRCDRAQTVRRNTDPGIRKRRDELPTGLDQSPVLVDTVYEAPLPFTRRLAAELTVRIENRQQCQRDARLLRGRHYTRRHLREVRVGLAARIVVQVVELADAREAALEHLHVRLSRERFGIIRCDVPDEAIHQLAPGPEAVRAGPPMLGQSRHAALKRVAMDVRHARQSYTCALVPGLRCRSCFHSGNRPVRDRDAHIGGPSLRQQRGLKK
jgi:hypothetical protein